MPYVSRLISPEEKLYEIWGLHWIYIAKGVLVFILVLLSARTAEANMLKGLMLVSEQISAFDPAPIVGMMVVVKRFFILAGFFYIAHQVVKVMTTEIGMTSRRVIYKYGFIFVNIKDIDVEEIRGERADMGWLGALLGYAYIFLDCRFIGDVKLPAIYSPDKFMKLLHKIRVDAQSGISVAVGKNDPIQLNVVAHADEKEVKNRQPATPMPSPDMMTQLDPRNAYAADKDNNPMYDPQKDPTLSSVEKADAVYGAKPDIPPPPMPLGVAPHLVNGGEVAQQMAGQIAPQVAQQVARQVTARVAREVTAQVAQQVTAQVANQVTAQVVNEVAGQVVEQMAGQMAGQIADQVTEQVTENVQDKIAEDPILALALKKEEERLKPDTNELLDEAKENMANDFNLAKDTPELRATYH